ncbi:PilZ domain-containing protein [Halospina denitrificans]|uniref:PilZ domain-containing protein n=1 Tax=Halospina denitrificans TaxID=332522 RepID=A0A4R7JTJ8_9GAMM|nr:PilZ domain-containing protein [Halospina denitrificans]TDT41345.1 PilZ domain-containing protein [Halospina denitrificans]
MNERRRQQRLPWVSMDARVKLRKGLIGSTWISVNVVDYSRLGIGIVTEEEVFKPDSRVQVSLRLGTEVGELTVDQVSAHVRHSEPHENGHFYGLEFDEDPGKGVTESLERIEGILNRHQNLTERMQ